MPTQSIPQLHASLSGDLKKLGSDGVVNDVVRKTFTARINGAIFEFGHKQADPAFWSGVKHYGSGPSSRFRMRRTPVVATTAVVKRPARRKAAALAVAV